MTRQEADRLLDEYDRLEYEARRLHRMSVRARGGDREFDAGLAWMLAEDRAAEFFDEIIEAVLFFDKSRTPRGQRR